MSTSSTKGRFDREYDAKPRQRVHVENTLKTFIAMRCATHKQATN